MGRVVSHLRVGGAIVAGLLASGARYFTSDHTIDTAFLVTHCVFMLVYFTAVLGDWMQILRFTVEREDAAVSCLLTVGALYFMRAAISQSRCTEAVRIAEMAYSNILVVNLFLLE